MAREQRIAAARRWYDTLPSATRPSWDDVRLVAAMDIREESVLAALLVMGDRAALLRDWEDLQFAIDAGGGREQVTVPATLSTDERLAALTAWRDGPRRAASGARRLSDADLARIARSAASTPAELTGLWLASRLTAEEAAAVASVLVAPAAPVGDPDTAATTPTTDRSTRNAGPTPPAPTPPAPGPAPPKTTSNAAGTERTASKPAESSRQGTQPGGRSRPRQANRDQARRDRPTDQHRDHRDRPPARHDDQGRLDRSSAAPSSPVSPPQPAEEWLADLTFARWTWESRVDPAAARPIDIVGEGGGLRLSWPPSASESGGWIAYRVVSSEEYQPVNAPDMGDLLGVTRRQTALDPRVGTQAVRHYAIWVNHGATEAAARSGQAVLHARGTVVLPVADLILRVEGNRVHGRWTQRTGGSAVRVMRVPVDRAATLPGYQAALTFPAEIIVKDGGFTDTPSAGGSFEYRVFAVAQVDGSDVLSTPVTARVTVDEHVEPVTDLRVDRQDDGDLQLSWTPPRVGRVEIYRLNAPSPEGLRGVLLPRDALPVQLREANRLVQPTEQVEGRTVITSVPMPPGWTRAYFVPVTVLGDSALRVGDETVIILPLPPTQVRCIQRVSHQVITFAWPEGVEMVRVNQGPRGAPAGEGGDARLVELTRQVYDEQGGIFLERPLPATGCSLHVYGVSYHRGAPVLSVPVTLSYPGLIQFEYRVHSDQPPPAPAAQRGRFGRPAPTVRAPVTRRLQVWGSQRMDRVRLVAVQNPNRLPLHSGDGHTLHDELIDLTPDQVPVVGPVLPTTGGFVRLFVVGLPPDYPPVAILDPPITDLMLR